MNRQDLAAYDALPAVVDRVAVLVRTLYQLPLDEMLPVLDRVEAAGCYNAGGRTAPASPEQVARHRALVEAARTFRDTATAALAPTGGGG